MKVFYASKYISVTCLFLLIVLSLLSLSCHSNVLEVTVEDDLSNSLSIQKSENKAEKDSNHFVSSVDTWKSMKHAADCTHPIYCQGELLATIQKSKIFNDSKTFVDMPLRYDVETVLRNFQNRESIEKFLVENFYAAGSDVVPHIPVDYTDYPTFLHEIKDNNLRNFAHAVHRIWKDLVREFRPIGNDTTFLQLPYPFVVPGGRFREFFYWDSYWIVEGLLVSGMVQTARNVLLNFLYLVETVGFVPNGARLYFLNRSQPPLLTQMVQLYFEQTGDIEFLKKALPVLDKEYDFWINERNVELKDPASGEIHTLFVHKVVSSIPRPESWLEDSELTKSFPDAKKKEMFGNLAGACESGWDFSSRWFKDRTTMESIATSDIVPVDLNAYIYKNEATLSQLNRLIGNEVNARFYERQRLLRKNAIDIFLYNSQDGVWYDLDRTTMKQNFDFTIASYVPLWANLHEGKDIQKILNHMRKNKVLNFVGGIPTTLRPIHQQWDYLNAWSPLQWFMVKGLQNINAGAEAIELARKWVTSNFCGWVVKDTMFEKYNASKIGVPGGGGEYIVQEGFGWTNGVILSFLSEFGSILHVDESVCYSTLKPKYNLSIVLLIIVLAIIAVGLTLVSDRLYRDPSVGKIVHSFFKQD